MSRKRYVISAMLLFIFSIGFAGLSAFLFNNLSEPHYIPVENTLMAMIFLNSLASFISCCGFIVTLILSIIGGKE